MQRPTIDRSQMTTFFQRLLTDLYGTGPVPADQGGLLFRTVCEQCRSRGDLFWTESRLHDLARELGYWPWSISQIEAAIRLRMAPGPVDELALAGRGAIARAGGRPVPEMDRTSRGGDD